MQKKREMAEGCNLMRPLPSMKRPWETNLCLAQTHCCGMGPSRAEKKKRACAEMKLMNGKIGSKKTKMARVFQMKTAAEVEKSTWKYPLFYSIDGCFSLRIWKKSLLCPTMEPAPPPNWQSQNVTSCQSFIIMPHQQKIVLTSLIPSIIPANFWDSTTTFQKKVTSGLSGVQVVTTQSKKGLLQ